METKSERSERISQMNDAAFSKRPKPIRTKALELLREYYDDPKWDEMTAEVAKTIWHYDPETGIFTWNADSVLERPDGLDDDVIWHEWATTEKRRAQERADSLINKKGYRSIVYQDRVYSAHRLAWLMMTDTWPDFTIDHIDRNPSNNAFSNLRDATQKVNNQERYARRVAS